MHFINFSLTLRAKWKLFVFKVKQLLLNLDSTAWYICYAGSEKVETTIDNPSKKNIFCDS